jgi:hypothetical protein
MKSLGDLNMVPDTASVVVSLTVEVKCGAWGPDCTIEQAVSQATREAETKLANAINGDGSMRVMAAESVRVICPAKKK